MTDVTPGSKDLKKTQINFEKGVNYKTGSADAGEASAERGEASKCQNNFNWTHEPCKADHARSPETKPQMNFPNGN
jgi:hypothetical protein